MMLVKQTTMPTEALPVTEFKDHLRLGTGFTDDAIQDSVLENYLRASIAAIEARTGKVLIARSFSWTLTTWRSLNSQTLPVSPVIAVTEVKVIDQNEDGSVVPASKYRLERDSQRPRLTAISAHLPNIPTHGAVKVSFDAGFAANWSELSPDLGQAVFLLAAHYYENRNAVTTGEQLIPFGVSLLIDRYRTIRLFGSEGVK